MLICQTCHKHNATVHRIDVHWDSNEPRVAETHLCAPCAKSVGIPVQAPPTFSKVLGMLSKAFLPKEQPGGAEAAEGESVTSCPDCGWTARDLRQTQRLGCPKDYEIFEEQLAEILERMHGHTEHADLAEDSVLDRLAGELDEAVRQEDYETAGRLRDEIQRFEDSLEADRSLDASSDAAPQADNG